MSRTGRTLVMSPAALDRLVQDGYSLAYGARFLKRTIESRIKLPISQRWNEGTHFVATVEDGRIEIEVDPPSLAASA